MPISPWLIMWQWIMQIPVKARAEHDHAALALDDHAIAPFRHGQRLAVDRHDLERDGVDVEDVAVMRMRLDDRPFLDRPELDPLIDAVEIECLAVDEDGESLTMEPPRKVVLSTPSSERRTSGSTSG